MKKIILALSLIFTISIISAQDTTASRTKATPEQRAKQATERLEKKVMLTAEQKPKVYDLALAKVTKMKAIREKYKDQPDQKEAYHQEMKAVNAEYNSGIKAILSIEQSAKLDSMKQEDKKHNSTPEQKAQRTVDKLDETVKLTAEQKTQVYSIALNRVQKSQAIRKKYKDQPDQKEQVLTEMKAVNNEYKSQLKLILTPEQAVLLDAKKREHHKEGKDLKTKPSVKETPSR